MAFEQTLLKRAARRKQTFARPIVSGLRLDKIQALDAAVSKGQIDQDGLTTADGSRRFLLGITPLDSSVVMQ